MNQLWVYELYLNLQANVSISPGDNSCIEVVLRCVAAEGDGLGPHDLNDGGILATVMAAGFKGIGCPIYGHDLIARYAYWI